MPIEFNRTTFAALALYQSKANLSQNFAKISHYKTLNLAQYHKFQHHARQPSSLILKFIVASSFRHFATKLLKVSLSLLRSALEFCPLLQRYNQPFSHRVSLAPDVAPQPFLGRLKVGVWRAFSRYFCYFLAFA